MDSTNADEIRQIVREELAKTPFGKSSQNKPVSSIYRRTQELIRTAASILTESPER